MGRQMLLRSRVLVDQCHLAAASSRKAAATLAAVGLTHKETASSVATALWLLAATNWHLATIVLLQSSIGFTTRVVYIIVLLCPACCFVERAGVVY